MVTFSWCSWLVVVAKASTGYYCTVVVAGTFLRLGLGSILPSGSHNLHFDDSHVCTPDPHGFTQFVYLCFWDRSIWSTDNSRVYSPAIIPVVVQVLDQ